MSNACLSYVDQYGDLLSSRPDLGRPHPLLFSQAHCTGTVWPALNSADPSGAGAIANPAGTAFGSLYLPSGWKLILTTASGATKTFLPSALPALYSATDSLLADAPNDTTWLKDAVVSATLTSYAVGNGTLGTTGYPLSQWKLDMCLHQTSTVVGSRTLQSYAPASSECDALLTNYCLVQNDCLHKPRCMSDGQPEPECAPCVCLCDQQRNYNVYCAPDSTLPECQTHKDQLAQFLPVTCLGQRCSLNGYRWSTMINQRCNTTLCEQLVTLVGNQIVVQGSTSLWCGNQVYSVGPTVTPSPVVVPPLPTTTSSPAHWPTYLGLLVGAAAVVLFLILPMAFIIYYRSFSTEQRLISATGRGAPPPPTPGRSGAAP